MKPDQCLTILKSGPRKGTPCNRTRKKNNSKSGYHDTNWYCGTHFRIYRQLTTVQSMLPPLSRRKLSDGSVEHILPIIYPNQAKAAGDIMNYFMQNIRAVTLNCEMQGGKTGAAKELCNLFGHHFKDDYKISVILTINDNELLNQARREFGQYVPPNYIFGAPDLQCREYLKLLKENNPGSKILIIIDESHYGTDKGGSLYRFFDQADIGLDGCNLPENVYLTTISATTNAEVALLGNENIYQYKRQVVLEPGDNYYGIKEMLDNNEISNAWELKTDNDWLRMAELCHKYCVVNKYFIIRCHDNNRIKKLRDIVTGSGKNWRFIAYDQHSVVKDINQIVGHAPGHPTIIGIARKLSASKQLQTQHIRLLFDYSVGHISTTVQGLPGRRCGYGKQGHNVLIYANKKHCEVYSMWAREGFLPKATPNDKHVTGGVTGRVTDSWEKNVPVTLDISSVRKDLKRISGHNMHLKLEQLFIHQHPQLMKDYSVQLSGNGILKIDPNSAQTTRTLWWDNIIRLNELGNKTIGYPRTIKNVNVNAGYQMFVNVDSDTAYVCCTKRINPRGDPKVGSNCGYQPRKLNL